MPSKLILAFESTVTWGDSGTTRALTMQNLATNSGRNGEIHDWGAAPRTGWYYIRAVGTNGFESSPTLGLVVKFYVRGAGLGGTAGVPTNDDGTGDVALSSINKLLNLDPVCVVVADEAAANIPTAASAVFFCPDRHFGITVFNGTNVALENTANAWVVEVTPFEYEAQ